MKKIITKLCLGLLLITYVTSCTDDFTELNTDPKNFTEDAVTAVAIATTKAPNFGEKRILTILFLFSCFLFFLSPASPRLVVGRQRVFGQSRYEHSVAVKDAIHK